MRPSLELTTQLLIETEHKSLYSWSLNEFDADGKEAGGPFIPWAWSLYFIATDVSRLHTTRLEGYPEPHIEETNLIKCSLRSIAGEFHRPIRYSMIGTKRRIEVFALNVHRLAGDEPEQCELHGNIEWVHQEEFSSLSETIPDALYVNMHLRSARFDRLLETIGDGKDTTLAIRLNRVSGFYAHWSPDIKTGSIKVLADQEEQVPEIPLEMQKKPPVLGAVGEFSISAERRFPPPLPPPDERTKEPAEEVERPDAALSLSPPPNAPPEKPGPWKEIGMLVVKRLNQQIYALWFVVALLALLLLFKH